MQHDVPYLRDQSDEKGFVLSRLELRRRELQCDILAQSGRREGLLLGSGRLCLPQTTTLPAEQMIPSEVPGPRKAERSLDEVLSFSWSPMIRSLCGSTMRVLGVGVEAGELGGANAAGRDHIDASSALPAYCFCPVLP